MLMLTCRRGGGRNNLEFGMFSRQMAEITIGTSLSKMFKPSEPLKGATRGHVLRYTSISSASWFKTSNYMTLVTSTVSVLILDLQQTCV